MWIALAKGLPDFREEEDGGVHLVEFINCRVLRPAENHHHSEPHWIGRLL